MVCHHRDGGGRQAQEHDENDLIAAANRAESDSVASGARQGIPAAGGACKSLRCDRPRDRSGASTPATS
jgi:hypothetical protein